MADFDFSNPPVSRVTADVNGVAICLWGMNGVGKTPVACGMPKPYYLAFEGGLTGIDGVPFAPMRTWKDFLAFVKWATSPATAAKAHEIAQTIICDTVDVMADYCMDFVCAKLGIQSLGETRYTADGKRDGSVNAYNEFGREFRRATRALRNGGFTLVYIAHDGGYRDEVNPETQQKYTKMYPSGDKRAIEAVCNDVDVLGYMRAVPLDDNGKAVYSTIYFAPNTQFHTRSRYPDIVPYIPEVTADKLIQAIVDAKEAELKRKGVTAATFEEQQAPFVEDPDAPSFEDLRSEARDIAMKLAELGRKAEYDVVVEKYLGKGKSVMDSTPAQMQLVEMIISDLRDISF